MAATRLTGFLPFTIVGIALFFHAISTPVDSQNSIAQPPLSHDHPFDDADVLRRLRWTSSGDPSRSSKSSSVVSFGQLESANSSSDEFELHRFEAIQFKMGVRFQIIVYAPNRATAVEGIDAAYAEIDRLEQIFSDYDPESELFGLSESAPHARFVEVSDELWDLMQQSNSISRLSDGAFDLTIGPLTQLWREARRNGVLPDNERLQSAKAAVGYQFVEFHPRLNQIRLTASDMRLDAGGIAKGYAADAAIAVLRELGIERALVNASGDITCSDPPPDKIGWTVGVTGLDPTSEYEQLIEIANQSVATSGDAFQHIVVEGERYSHIVDPATGLGLRQRSGVTVLANDGATADAWASAISVLGPQRGIDLAESLDDIEALVLYLDNETPTSRKTSGFPEALPASSESGNEDDRDQD